jgi:hypothetical protein
MLYLLAASASVFILHCDLALLVATLEAHSRNTHSGLFTNDWPEFASGECSSPTNKQALASVQLHRTRGSTRITLSVH